MIRLVLICLLISVIAGLLGFTGISSAAAGAAKIVFGVFLGLFLLALVLLFLGK